MGEYRMAAEHLVIVGKGGVGKTTIAANLSAALAETGKRVLLIGYDSHWNSTATLRGANQLRTLSGWEDAEHAPLLAAGYRDSLCIEAGALVMAGEAAQAAHIPLHPIVRQYRPDLIIHDVSWEPTEEFELPAAVDGVPRLVVVTSADKGALQVVNQFFGWLNTVAAANCRFGGVVVNNLSGPLYEAIVSDFASQTGAAISATVSRSVMVSVSDFCNQTLLESAPLSHVSYMYRKLARTLTDHPEVPRPKPLGHDAMQRWALKWGEIITELETGVVAGGLGI
jgi:nitrogenase iron protein NifH